MLREWTKQARKEESRSSVPMKSTILEMLNSPCNKNANARIREASFFPSKPKVKGNYDCI